MTMQMKVKGGAAPAKKTTTAKKPPASKPRTTPRVTDTEDNRGSVTKNVQHRQALSPAGAMAELLANGDVLISYQASELVPVAQYASVTVGPIQIAARFTGTDISSLAVFDWDDESAVFTEEQQNAYDKVRGAIRAMSNITEDALSEDRETVERSVRMHNEREKSEQKSRGRGK